ncbi:OLC1v1021308C1 [Oldenlandia corymbosa var. corymbosa]|uniref:non-specific serine/threonine protein kinase n=1 Tax=Oldenlandia corymbosa var. corymbosa TaxID=529605 RepID=A0AAV1BWI8_OLDCO|nr:OLC1v1021308C1 [Oldenlandia corymbosa var. corymbosa]
MEGTSHQRCQLETLPLNDYWRLSECMENLQLKSMVSPKGTSKSKGSPPESEVEVPISQRASQTLWATGKLAEPIPDGFYFITPERRFKEFYDTIPTLDELQYLESEGFRPNVILVDSNKDKKLLMLKQLALTLVKRPSSSPAVAIKKIAALVSDFYKSSNMEASMPKDGLEEVRRQLENHGIQMLCQIKQGTCHSRAILFKVLADSVGVDCKLMVGLPREGVVERIDSFKHMCVTVFVDSVEFIIDLLHFPGKLTPCTSEAVFHCHMVASQSETALNSYESPMEPCSPICGLSGQVDIEGADFEEYLQPTYRSKLEASTSFSGSSMRSVQVKAKASIEQKSNVSHSEPDVTNGLWWLSHKHAIAEPSTATSSPEPSFFRGHGRSMLGGRTRSFKECNNNVITSRSAGASPIDARRRRRRCISMVPEIGDDIVRAVRAMNGALKRNQVSKENVNASSNCLGAEKDANIDNQETVSRFYPDDQGERVTTEKFQEKPMNSQRAMSLPSSPRYFTNYASGRCEAAEFLRGPDMISKMNKMLEVEKILNKQLFPFQEWNIEFSELTVGTRIGIGFFGEVFRGMWNGIQVAIKVFLEQDLTVENIEDFCTEISILSRVRHPNVILFLGACTKPPHLSMVTEYMEMGSLYYLIHVSGQKKRLSWRRRIKMLCEICRGLMCLHRMKIVHRDLKSANCLVNKNWTVKICDFGLSRVMTTRPMKDSSSAGTPEWMAPELIRNEPFTEKCDIFSFGVIIWELCTLNKPWDGIPSAQVVYAVGNDGKSLEVPEGPLGKLITDCWGLPDERPSCRDILLRLLDCQSTLC